MAVTAGVSGRALWISGGVGAGVLGACVVALFTGGLSQLFGGAGQEVFNAGILAFAVVMLTWHNVWMSRHGREDRKSTRLNSSHPSISYAVFCLKKKKKKKIYIMTI